MLTPFFTSVWTRCTFIKSKRAALDFAQCKFGQGDRDEASSAEILMDMCKG